MSYKRLKIGVQRFFAPYMVIEGNNIRFPYSIGDHVLGQEYWTENGVRIPTGKGIWLVVECLPVSVSDLFIGHSASELLCFCHYHTGLISGTYQSAFAALGLVPGREQFARLRSLFPNAKIHTVFDTGISGRVADCKIATWQLGKQASFTLSDDHGELYCNKRQYRIPIDIFSLSRFEKLAGIRSGIRTHKPQTPFETFYDSFIVSD